MPGLLSRSWRAWSALSTAVVLVATTSLPAEAQLGRLKKMAEDAAKKKAGVEQPKEPEKKTATAVAGEDPTISAERLDAVIAVLSPLVTAAELQVASAAAAASYEAATKEASKCMETFASAGIMPTAAAAAEIDKSAKQTERLSKAAEQAMAAGNYRLSLYSQDSSTVSQIRGLGTMLGGKCKPYPYKPAAMLDAEAINLANAAAGKANAASGEEGAFEVPANQRAGMSTYMFGRVRERAALYALLATKTITNSQAGKEGVFTEAELATLDARKAALVKMAPLFKGNGLRYLTWNDIKAW